MALFKRRTPQDETPITLPKNVPVEIITNKNARKEVIEQSKKAQHELNKLLEENHFTIKIMVAAGAQNRRKKKG